MDVSVLKNISEVNAPPSVGVNPFLTHRRSAAVVRGVTVSVPGFGTHRKWVAQGAV